MMLRPTIGTFCTISTLSCEAMCDASVCNCCTSLVTTMLSLTVPTSSLKSTRARSPVARVTREVPVLKPESSALTSYSPISSGVNV